MSEYIRTVFVATFKLNSDLVPYIGVVSNIDTIYETYPQYRKSNGWIYYKAYASSDSSYIDGYETSNGYGEQTKQGHFVAPQFRQKQNGTWGAWTSYILSSDLGIAKGAGHCNLIMYDTAGTKYNVQFNFTNKRISVYDINWTLLWQIAGS